MLRKVRLGEALAAVGAVGLTITLSLRCFALAALSLPDADGGLVIVRMGSPGDSFHESGWANIGWFAAGICALAIAAAALLLVSLLTQDSPALPVFAQVVTAALGIIATIALAIRVLIAEPGLGIGAPDQVVDVRPTAYLALLSCALMTVGGWYAMRDERTEAARAPDVPLRPLPTIPDA